MPLVAALNELLAIDDGLYGQSGLYSLLYQSTLKLDSATIVGGKATINITGKTQLGGVCDNPRVKAQIEDTTLQFSTVTQVAESAVQMRRDLENLGGKAYKNHRVYMREV